MRSKLRKMSENQIAVNQQLKNEVKRRRNTKKRNICILVDQHLLLTEAAGEAPPSLSEWGDKSRHSWGKEEEEGRRMGVG